MADHDVGVEREQRGGEIRRCCGLATVRADRGVIEAVVALNRVARARGAAALVAIEAGPEEPAAFRLHEIAADRRDRTHLGRGDRGHRFGDERNALRELPRETRERDARADLERSVRRGAKHRERLDLRKRDDARRRDEVLPPLQQHVAAAADHGRIGTEGGVRGLERTRRVHRSDRAPREPLREPRPDPVEDPVQPERVRASHELDLPPVRPRPYPMTSRLAALLLREGAKDLVRRDRKLADAHPDGVVDRVRDRGRGRNDAELADALRAVRTAGVALLDQDRPDAREVGGPRQRVIEVGGVHQPSLLVDELLAERGAETHRDAADDLALDHGRVDRLPDVVGGDVVEDPHAARVAVHLHLHRVRGERVGRGEVRRLARAGRLHDLVGVGGFVREDATTRCRVGLPHSLRELARGLAHGVPGHVRSTRGPRALIDRGALAVDREHLDTLVGEAELLRGDLCQNRALARPGIGAPEPHPRAPVGVEVDGGHARVGAGDRVRAAPVHRGRDADAAVPLANALLLVPADRVPNRDEAVVEPRGYEAGAAQRRRARLVRVAEAELEWVEA